MLLPVVDAAEGQLKADAQLTYGSLLLSLKKYAEAIAPLEAFLQGKPEGEAAVKGAGELAICYARTGQLDKAKKVYADLVEKNRQHPLIAADHRDSGRGGLRRQRHRVVGRVVGPPGDGRKFGRKRVERKVGAGVEPVQGGQAVRGRRQLRRGAQEESARGDRGRGGLGPRPDSRTTRPERGGAGHVRPGDRQVSRQQAARRGPVVGRPAPRKAEAAPTGGRALPAFGEGISAVSQARRRALPLGLGAARS